MSRKLDPHQQLGLDPELTELLNMSDEDLHRQAEKDGHDITTLVASMKVCIAQKLSEVALPSRRKPPMPAGVPADLIPLGGKLKEADGRRVQELQGSKPRRPNRDILGLQLGAVTFLVTLLFHWTFAKAVRVEQGYRWWLQRVYDGEYSDVVDTDVLCFKQAHQMNPEYEQQMSALFGPERPAVLQAGSLVPAISSTRKPQGAGAPLRSKSCNQQLQPELPPQARKPRTRSRMAIP